MFDYNEWKTRALNRQGDLVMSVFESFKPKEKANLDKLHKAIAKIGHSFSRHAVRAGAENALSRMLLDKEGYDTYFLPIPNKPRNHKPTHKRVAS